MTTFLLAGLLQTSAGQSIGLNLGSGRADSQLDPADSAGAVAQTNWNNLGGAAGGPLILNDSAGAVTASEVTWVADEEWSIGDVPADADGKLLSGFFSENNNGGDDSSFTISEIPYSLYDLYIYVSHDRAAEDVILSEESGAFADFTAIEDDAAITGPVSYVRQTDSGVGTGTYVLFPSLSTRDLKINLTAVNIGGSLERNAISAIQIVNVTPGDTDGDGMHDAWEEAHGLDPNDNGLDPNNNGVTGDPNNGAAGDPDSDGSPNIRELEQGSDPNDEDTDDDTLLDGVETGTGVYAGDMDRGTSPTKTDTDGDTLGDEVETNSGTVDDPETATGTNPNEADTDSDTLRDDWEVANSLSPFDDGTTDEKNGAEGDPDSDQSSNADEQTRGTDPQDDDSDDDNLKDGVESNDGNFVDANATGTDPLSADSDGDTLQDDVEDNSGVFNDLNNTGTNPNLPDTDGDFLRDDWEISSGLDPNDGNDNLLEAGGIGLNFGAGRDSASLNPADEAGVFAQANWNNLSGSVGGPLVLTDDTGAASGATVNLNLDEEWSVAGPALDPNGVLLTGWFSANNAGAPNSIDVTDIPYGTYDLVVYFNHDRANEDTEVSESNGGFPMFVTRTNNPDVLSALVFEQQVASAADIATESGNFAIFQNLTGASLNLVLSGGDGDNVRNPLTGIQLINRGGGGGIVITDIQVDEDAGSAEITWTSAANRVYAIDRSSNLSPGEWLEISDEVLATGDSTSFTDSGIDFSTNPKRFYRVRLASDVPE